MPFHKYLSTLSLITVLASPGLALAKQTFTAPNGELGGNLSVDKTQISRLHGELSYFTTNQNGTTAHALMLTTGFGVKVAGNFEITAGLAGMGVITSTGNNQYAVGNLMLGSNYVLGSDYGFRLKVGGALAFGPWNLNGSTFTPEGLAQLAAGTLTEVYQELWYTYPTHVHLVIPTRFEFDALPSLVVTGDLTPDVAAGLNGNTSLLLLVFAPGIAYWASDVFAVGARLPVQLVASLGNGGNSEAQVAFEPFVRFDLSDSAFLASRFTLNLDEPGGFSFDSGKYWGLHLALGGNF